MKKLTLLLISTMALTMIARQACCQYIIDFKKQGDDYYNKGQYYAAAQLYQKAVSKVPDTARLKSVYPYEISHENKRLSKDKAAYNYLIYHLAESYRQYKDYADAEKWYAQSLQVDTGQFTLIRLYYGECLRATGDYQESIDQLERFLNLHTQTDEYSAEAKMELASCKFALAQFNDSVWAGISRLPFPVNDSGSTYAPVMYHRQLYFTSSRPVKAIDRQKENPFVNKLYEDDHPADQVYGQPAMILPSMPKDMQVAAVCFNAGGSMAYYTAWHYKKEEQKAIYCSKLKSDGSWSAPQKLSANVNAPGADNIEPFVTKDGNYLLFCSNRNGGSGGYDIWYCALNPQGLPQGEAQDMKYLNTNKDDKAPYYDEARRVIIFSTNGRVGMGGFDLYSAKGSIADGWSELKDMGYPINSSKDDIYYFPEEGQDKFYISSDRNSVCCLELYEIQWMHLTIKGSLLDCDSQQPLAGAEIKLKKLSDHSLIKEITTGPDGKYAFRLYNYEPVEVVASKAKYFAKKIEFTKQRFASRDTLYSDELCLKAYKIGKPIVIPRIFYDFDKATLRPESKLVLDSLAAILSDNPKLYVQINAHTDSVGTESYNLDLSQRRAQSCVDYLITKGIASERLKAKGYGEADPIAPNSLPNGKDNPDGRQLNRRTEFVVLKD